MNKNWSGARNISDRLFPSSLALKEYQMPPKQQRPRRAPEVTTPAPTAGRRRPREEEADDAERPARRTSSRRVHEERNAAAEAVQSQDLRINDVQRIRHTIRMMDHIIVVEADSSHNFGDLLPLLMLGMWSVMHRMSHQTPPHVIESLEQVPVEEVSADDCLVCLEAFGNQPADLPLADQERTVAADGQVRLPGCGHVFHKSCIGKWLQESQTCPTCRANVVAAASSTSESAASHAPPSSEETPAAPSGTGPIPSPSPLPQV